MALLKIFLFTLLFPFSHGAWSLLPSSDASTHKPSYGALALGYKALASSRTSDKLASQFTRSLNPISGTTTKTLDKNPTYRASSLSNSLLLANNNYNPFIDYNEFQDNVAEQETINFFQKGRSISLAIFGGYEAITFNMRQIYGDSPAFFGGSIALFIDLKFAIQVSGGFPRPHYNSLLGTSPNFAHMGLDFKYYLNKQKLVKGISEILSPYAIVGPLWFSVKGHNPNQASQSATPAQVQSTGDVPTAFTPTNSSAITIEEEGTLEAFSSFGFKIGVGVEMAFINKTHIGLEASYLLVNVDVFENADLSRAGFSNANTTVGRNFFEQQIYPVAPTVSGYKFIGDIITATIIIGLNF